MTKIVKIAIAILCIATMGYPGTVPSGYWNGVLVEYKDLHAAVGVEDVSGRTAAYSLFDQLCYVVVDSFNVLNFAVIRFSNSPTFLADVSALGQNKLLAYAEPVIYGTLDSQVHPNDEFYAGTAPPANPYPRQWPLHNDGNIMPDPQLPSIGVLDVDIDAPEAWAYETGSSSSLVAVLDSGIPISASGELTHPDLDDASRFILGTDFSGDVINGLDDNTGHGTHVVGVIGAETNNNIGIAGIDWHARIIVHKIVDGVISWGVASVNAANAMRQAVDDGANVINLSSSYRAHIEVLEQAILYASEAPSPPVIVCSTGNNGEGAPTCPSHHVAEGLYHPFELGYPTLLSVGSIDPIGDITNYSSFVQGEHHVSLVAPGGAPYGPGHNGRLEEQVFSTYQVSAGSPIGYKYINGTSMAAPHVSGVASLLFSRFPQASAEEICSIITSSAVDFDGGGQDFDSGWGLLNAYYAVAPPSNPTGLSISGSYGDNPELNWDANDEPDLLEYNVYKAEPSGSWFKVGTVSAETTTFTDMSCEIGGFRDPRVYYHVKAVDTADQESGMSNLVFTRVLSIHKKLTEKSNLPAQFNLTAIYPNPFNPSTRIEFALPMETSITLVVYDSNGRRVKTLLSKSLGAGYYNILWNGTNQAGHQVPGGMYFARLQAGEYSSVVKMVCLR